MRYFHLDGLCNFGFWAQYSGFEANGPGGNVRLRSAPIFFALAILAACTQVPVGRVSVIPGQISSIDSAVRYEAADRVIPLVIRGNPFAGTQEEAVAAIGSVLRLPPGWPRASFASTPHAERGRGVRLVLVFNALDPRLEVRELCRNADAIDIAGETAARAGITRILAAFCIGSRLGRGASASTALSATMNPEFRALLAGVLQGVFRHRRRRPDSFS